jgi:hypothetical protein
MLVHSFRIVGRQLELPKLGVKLLDGIIAVKPWMNAHQPGRESGLRADTLGQEILEIPQKY